MWPTRSAVSSLWPPLRLSAEPEAVVQTSVEKLLVGLVGAVGRGEGGGVVFQRMEQSLKTRRTPGCSRVLTLVRVNY